MIDMKYQAKMIKRTIQAGEVICDKYGEVIPDAYKTFTSHIEIHLPYCGNCGKAITDAAHQFCGWCGEGIDWGKGGG